MFAIAETPFIWNNNPYQLPRLNRPVLMSRVLQVLPNNLLLLNQSLPTAHLKIRPAVKAVPEAHAKMIVNWNVLAEKNKTAFVLNVIGVKVAFVLVVAAKSDVIGAAAPGNLKIRKLRRLLELLTMAASTSTFTLCSTSAHDAP